MYLQIGGCYVHSNEIQMHMHHHTFVVLIFLSEEKKIGIIRHGLYISNFFGHILAKLLYKYKCLALHMEHHSITIYTRAINALRQSHVLRNMESSSDIITMRAAYPSTNNRVNSAEGRGRATSGCHDQKRQSSSSVATSCCAPRTSYRTSYLLSGTHR